MGIVCNKGDYPKLTEQLKKLEDNEFNGGVSNPTHRAMNLVPYRVWPPAVSERITHRTGLRTQVLFDKLGQLR